jgi:4,5-DOPA dioxygenase extradiol
MSTTMPVVFVGHGSPMNAIEDNAFTRGWEEMARKIPKPTTVLAVSAHWFTKGVRTSDTETPKTIYDMYGFPDELYRATYNCPGSPELARSLKGLISRDVQIDTTWGIDHGAWSVLRKMYPDADIPVVQLSIDKDASEEVHFQIGQELSALREKGVLILASGNVVHNLARINWRMEDGFPWAVEFDRYIVDKIINRQYQQVIQYQSAGQNAAMAFVTPEHYYPLLYALGASRTDDTISVFNQACTVGSISMTCYLFEAAA